VARTRYAEIMWSNQCRWLMLRRRYTPVRNAPPLCRVYAFARTKWSYKCAAVAVVYGSDPAWVGERRGQCGWSRVAVLTFMQRIEGAINAKRYAPRYPWLRGTLEVTRASRSQAFNRRLRKCVRAACVKVMARQEEIKNVTRIA